MTDKKSKLEMLRDKAGSVAGDMTSDRGLTWNPRVQRSKDYLAEHSQDWDILRAFFAKPYHDVQIALPDGGYVTIKIKLPYLWSLGKNHVSDLHFSNPETWIRTRRGREDREFDRMLNDVAYAVHSNAGSEEVTRKCLVTGLYQGGGLSAWHFDQEGYWEDAKVRDAYGEPVMSEPTIDEEGNAVPPMPMVEFEEDGETPVKEFHATSQRVVNRFRPLSHVLIDPDGREHDFCDSRYVGIKYKRSLQDCWDDEDTYHEVGRKMLVNAIAESNASKGSSDRDRGTETDPSFINVEIVELWDKTSFEIIHIPMIGDEIAKFDIGVSEWPRALKQAKRFPFRLIAEEWNPPDSADTEGIYPVPLFRHARGLVEDIIRLYELFFRAGGKVVDKWVTYEGALKSDNFVEIMSTDQDEIATLDPQAVQRAFNGGSIGTLPPPAQVLQRLERGEKIAQALGFAEMIQAAKRELYELFGQNDPDKTATATEIVKVAAKTDQRVTESRKLVGQAFNDGTEIAFLLLAENQTLPVPYQMTTASYGEERWGEFEVEQLYGLDLIFDHVTDSSAPKNREYERQVRRDFMASYLPFVDSKRKKDDVARWAAEAHDTNGLVLDDLFHDEAPEIAKQLLALRTQIHAGEIDPADPNVAAQLMELETALIEAVVSEADKEEVATGQAGSGGGGAARGAAPKSMTPGQMAAAGAAAGMTNVGA